LGSAAGQCEKVNDHGRGEEGIEQEGEFADKGRVQNDVCRAASKKLEVKALACSLC